MSDLDLDAYLARIGYGQTLTAQRARADGRAVLRNRDLAVREKGSVRTEHVRDPEHLLEVLDREFGLSFPVGTRFARPIF